MFAHVYKLDSFEFYHELNLQHTHTKIDRTSFSHFSCNFFEKCIFYLPINGPNAVTKTAFPIICHPNAAGSCSNEQYSDTVNVKLLKAIPIKITEHSFYVLYFTICHWISNIWAFVKIERKKYQISYKPLKKPQINNHVNTILYSVCSAITVIEVLKKSNV